MKSLKKLYQFDSSITVDVEDGISIAMKDYFNVIMPPTDRVVKNVNEVLELLEHNGTKATFFILGEVAKNYPNIIKTIASLGHELGVHGYMHEQLFKLSREKAKEDIHRAKNLIEDISGTKVNGFRAPAFSLIPSTAWALEILAELDFTYDSSIVPVLSKRYGWNDFEKEIIRVKLSNDASIIEAPLPVVKIFGHHTPACGGGYLRYFPLRFTHWAFSTILKNQPVILYLHPYELDINKYPEYFEKSRKTLKLSKSLPLLFYQYKKDTVKKKLISILNTYSFLPLNEVINSLVQRNSIKTHNLKNLVKS